MAIGIDTNVLTAAARPENAERVGFAPDERTASNFKFDNVSQGDVSLRATRRQLAQSVVRAKRREPAMSRAELAGKATLLRNQFSGPAYNAAAAAREVPDTDDPALLARAKQATAFAQDYGRGGATGNPFKKLSDHQLTLVMYDDSGSYTTNERRAAWLEQYDRYEAWSKKVVAAAQAEYRATGRNDEFFQACIDYYNALPPIEQAQYPADYVARRQYWIENNKSFF